MKKYLILAIRIVFTLTSMADAQLFEKDNKKSFLERRINDVKHRIEILEKRVKEAWGQIENMKEREVNVEEYVILTEALDMARHMLTEELEHLKHEQKWRKTLPKKIAYKLNEIEGKIHRAWEKGNERIAKNLERELEEYKEKLHREFDNKIHKGDKLEITEDLIWKHMPEELRHKIQKHREAAQKLDEAGYEDMANELREKAQAMFEDAKKEIVEKLRRDWVKKHKKEGIVKDWWHRLSKHEQNIVAELKQELLKAAITGNKDYLNKIADRLREFYMLALSKKEHEKPASEKERIIKDLLEKKEQKEKKLEEMMTSYKGARAKGKMNEAAEIAKYIHVLKLEIQEIDRHIKKIRAKRDVENKKDAWKKEIIELRIMKKKCLTEIDELKARLKHHRKIGHKKGIIETELALAKNIKKLQDIEAEIAEHEKRMKQNAENKDKMYKKMMEEEERTMREMKLQKLMLQKQDILILFKRLESELKETDNDKTARNIIVKMKQLKAELAEIEALINKLSK